MASRHVSISTVFGGETSMQVPLAGSRDLWVVSEDPTLVVSPFCVSNTAYLSCEPSQDTNFQFFVSEKKCKHVRAVVSSLDYKSASNRLLGIVGVYIIIHLHNQTLLVSKTSPQHREMLICEVNRYR